MATDPTLARHHPDRTRALVQIAAAVVGAAYLVLWLYGLVVDKESGATFVPVNVADDWLHLVLGAAMVALGLLLRERPVTFDAAGRPRP